MNSRRSVLALPIGGTAPSPYHSNKYSSIDISRWLLDTARAPYLLKNAAIHRRRSVPALPFKREIFPLNWGAARTQHLLLILPYFHFSIFQY